VNIPETPWLKVGRASNLGNGLTRGQRTIQGDAQVFKK